MNTFSMSGSRNIVSFGVDIYQSLHGSTIRRTRSNLVASPEIVDAINKIRAQLLAESNSIPYTKEELVTVYKSTVDTFLLDYDHIDVEMRDISEELIAHGVAILMTCIGHSKRNYAYVQIACTDVDSLAMRIHKMPLTLPIPYRKTTQCVEIHDSPSRHNRYDPYQRKTIFFKVGSRDIDCRLLRFAELINVLVDEETRDAVRELKAKLALVPNNVDSETGKLLPKVLIQAILDDFDNWASKYLFD